MPNTIDTVKAVRKWIRDLNRKRLTLVIDDWAVQTMWVFADACGNHQERITEYNKHRPIYVAFMRVGVKDSTDVSHIEFAVLEHVYVVLDKLQKPGDEVEAHIANKTQKVRITNGN